jgi:hypothetical protein
MQLSLSLVDAAAIEEVPIDLWRELFNVTGWPNSLGGKRNAFTHDDVLSALTQDEPSDELLQALEALDALGSDAGREAIVAAMRTATCPSMR